MTSEKEVAISHLQRRIALERAMPPPVTVHLHAQYRAMVVDL
jgi:hypothetical protein